MDYKDIGMFGNTLSTTPQSTEGSGHTIKVLNTISTIAAIGIGIIILSTVVILIQIRKEQRLLSNVENGLDVS